MFGSSGTAVISDGNIRRSVRAYGCARPTIVGRAIRFGAVYEMITIGSGVLHMTQSPIQQYLVVGWGR